MIPQTNGQVFSGRTSLQHDRSSQTGALPGSTTVDLGGRFHRERIDVRSSQVSMIALGLSGRWNREHRHETVWNRLQHLDLSPPYTHELALEDASEAYELLETSSNEAV